MSVRNRYKSYIRINSQANDPMVSRIAAYFVLSNKNMWDMFHVCLLSVVLFHTLFFILAVKFHVDVKSIAAE